MRSSTPPSRAGSAGSAGDSSGNDDDHEEQSDAVVSSTTAALGSMQFGSVTSSTHTNVGSSRVLAPLSASTETVEAAEAGQEPFKARVLQKWSVAQMLVAKEFKFDSEKDDKDKDAESK
jgi:hypothetical protein